MVDQPTLTLLSNKDLGILASSVGNLLHEETGLQLGGDNVMVSFSSLLAQEVRARSPKLDLRTISAATVSLAKCRYRCKETVGGILSRVIRLSCESGGPSRGLSGGLSLRDLAETVSSLSELRCPGLRSALTDHDLGRLALERAYAACGVTEMSDRRRALLRIALTYAAESSLDGDGDGDGGCFDTRWIESLMIQELSPPLIHHLSSLDLAQAFHWMLVMETREVGWDVRQVPDESYERCKSAWIESVRQRRSEAKREGSLQSEVEHILNLIASISAAERSHPLIDPSSLYFEYLTPDQLFSIDITIINGQSRIAIEVDGPSHFTRNADDNEEYQPLGSTLLRNRILARHGWAVISIPWWEWRKREGDEGKLKSYLAGHLLSVEH